MSVTEDIADFVDASAPALGPADLIFVFGSTLPEAVLPALKVFRAGLAPLIVLTGGPNRRNPAHVESEAHAQLLHAQGITLISCSLSGGRKPRRRTSCSRLGSSRNASDRSGR